MSKTKTLEENQPGTNALATQPISSDARGNSLHDLRHMADAVRKANSLVMLPKQKTFPEMARTVCKLQAHIEELREIHRTDILRLVTRVLKAADLDLFQAVGVEEEENGEIRVRFRLREV